MGASVKLGQAVEPGGDPSQNEAIRRDVEEISYHDDKIANYLRAHPKELDKYLESGKITIDKYLWIQEKIMFPQTAPLLKNMGRIWKGTERHGIKQRTEF